MAPKTAAAAALPAASGSALVSPVARLAGTADVVPAVTGVLTVPLAQSMLSGKGAT